MKISMFAFAATFLFIGTVWIIYAMRQAVTQ